MMIRLIKLQHELDNLTILLEQVVMVILGGEFCFFMLFFYFYFLFFCIYFLFFMFIFVILC